MRNDGNTMFNFIDNYCERLEPGLWAEPLNAVTNLSFFIAAICAFYLARREDALNWRTGLLIGLIAAMGLGSTLFHTFAVVWAMLADTLPILFYQIVFIALYARRVIRLNVLYRAGLLGLFFVAMAGAMDLPRAWLNGSLEYGPAWLFLLGLSLWHLKNAGRERFGLLAASAVFTLSLAFRSMDMALCVNLPIGTHFVWHILNGLVLYLTTRAFILNGRKD